MPKDLASQQPFSQFCLERSLGIAIPLQWLKILKINNLMEEGVDSRLVKTNNFFVPFVESLAG